MSNAANRDVPSDKPSNTTQPDWWATPDKAAAGDWWAAIQPAPLPPLNLLQSNVPASAAPAVTSKPATSAATALPPLSLPPLRTSRPSILPLLTASAAGILLVVGGVVTALVIGAAKQNPVEPAAVLVPATPEPVAQAKATNRQDPPRESAVKMVAIPVETPAETSVADASRAALDANRPQAISPEEPKAPPVAEQPQAPAVASQPEEPKPIGAAPAAAAKLDYKRRRDFTEDDLRKQIAHAPEVGLDRSVARLESVNMVLLSRQALATGTHGEVGPVLMKKRDDLSGLPIRMGDACKTTPAAADHLQGGSIALRAILTDAAAGTADTRPDPEKLVRGLHSGQRSQQWQRPEAVPALMQLLMPENEAIRLVLIEQLAQIPGNKASLALANRALFDLNPEVRLAALEILKSRPQAEFRQALVDGLRYPWAVINDHAAEALVALKMTDSVPTIVAMLDEPNPDFPYDKPREGTMIREVVRVNHLNNCLMCHPVSFDVSSDKVRGSVPDTSKPPPAGASSGGYNSRSDEGVFVRADITYLQQDFSVPMPVAKHGLWPAVQRNDFMVRERHATPAELETAKKFSSAETRQPTEHDRAIFFALRGLTGQDPGPSADDWKRLFVRTADLTHVQSGLSSPGGIAADSTGILFFSDRGQQKIVRQGESSPTFLPSFGTFDGLALDAAHNRLLACQPVTCRILAIDLKTNEETVLFDGMKKGLAPRHVVVDKRGGVYFTTREALILGQGDAAHATVHYLSAQGTLTKLPIDAGHANGLGLSPEQNMLYVTSADSNKVFAYTLESAGVVVKKRVLATLQMARDAPVGGNGLATDPSGNIYIANPGRKAIEVLNPEGAHLGQIALPDAPVHCGIGGPEQKTLYITTATEVISVKLVREQDTVSVSR